MAHILLELDTTAPIINIYAPRYTINNAINTIIIESNEKLANYQDITLMDSDNNTYPLTFQRVSDTRYVGEVDFNNFPLGFVYINARMMDEVNNLSNVASATIEIKNSLEIIRVKSSHRTLVKSKLDTKKMKSKTHLKTMKLVLKSRNI